MTEHHDPLRRDDPDAAVSRWEDVLSALPEDRALPDLEVLLARAELPVELLHRDERVLKVLHEAVLARPFGDLDVVARVRTEVEVLVLEVEVLTDRLRGDDTPTTVAVDAEERLRVARARLEELRGLL